MSIFPEYLAALDLSLVGKARKTGLLDIRVHDLRDWAHDRHRTVDDTPYGGGAGMVMKPEPWGDALDTIAPSSDSPQPRLIVPSPAGRRFTQAMAEELSAEPWLVFACGRYEGIDARVAEYAGGRMRVDEVSIGDYVLNGGEVAVLVVVEAVARLLPGVIGNPESLDEESHTGGLLEYPVFTKPASWRGHDVPDVLLSGNHASISSWRNEQSLRRTRERRPDLVDHAASLGPELVGALGAGVEVRAAEPADAGELFTLQQACWLAEGRENGTFDIPALREDVDDVRRSFDRTSTLVVRAGDRLIGSVRGMLLDDDERPVRTWEIGRLMVAPDLHGRGLGRWLLAQAEDLAADAAERFELVTGAQSVRNQRLYKKAGYRPAPDGIAPIRGTVRLVKDRRRGG